MQKLIEKLYEIESEDSETLKKIDKDFEIRLNAAIDEGMGELSQEQCEKIKEEIMGGVVAMEREVFVYGFQCAVRLLVEGSIVEK